MPCTGALKVTQTMWSLVKLGKKSTVAVSFTSWWAAGRQSASAHPAGLSHPIRHWLEKPSLHAKGVLNALCKNLFATVKKSRSSRQCACCFLPNAPPFICTTAVPCNSICGESAAKCSMGSTWQVWPKSCKVEGNEKKKLQAGILLAFTIQNVGSQQNWASEPIDHQLLEHKLAQGETNSKGHWGPPASWFQKAVCPSHGDWAPTDAFVADQEAQAAQKAHH